MHCIIFDPDSSLSLSYMTKSNWNLSFIHYFFILPFMGHLYIVWQFSPYVEESGLAHYLQLYSWKLWISCSRRSHWMRMRSGKWLKILCYWLWVWDFPFHCFIFIWKKSRLEVYCSVFLLFSHCIDNFIFYSLIVYIGDSLGHVICLLIYFRFRSLYFSFNLFPVWQPYCWTFQSALVPIHTSSSIINAPKHVSLRFVSRSYFILCRLYLHFRAVIQASFFPRTIVDWNCLPQTVVMSNSVELDSFEGCHYLILSLNSFPVLYYF
jgi:hypothetical protein